MPKPTRSENRFLYHFEQNFGDHILSIYVQLPDMNPGRAWKQYKATRHDLIMIMLKGSIEFGNRNPQLN